MVRTLQRVQETEKSTDQINDKSILNSRSRANLPSKPSPACAAAAIPPTRAPPSPMEPPGAAPLPPAPLTAAPTAGPPVGAPSCGGGGCEDTSLLPNPKPIPLALGLLSSAPLSAAAESSSSGASAPSGSFFSFFFSFFFWFFVSAAGPLLAAAAAGCWESKVAAGPAHVGVCQITDAPQELLALHACNMCSSPEWFIQHA